MDIRILSSRIHDNDSWFMNKPLKTFFLDVVSYPSSYVWSLFIRENSLSNTKLVGWYFIKIRFTWVFYKSLV